MTITVAVKVSDGVVLASDSATTLTSEDGKGHKETIHIWNTANKIFNLRRGWPLGAMTWGLADIDNLTIAEHVKDLRHELTRGTTKLDENNYFVSEVAERVRDFFLTRLDGSAPGRLGLLVAGYDVGARRPEMYEITCGLAANTANTTQVFDQLGTGLLQWGQPEAIARLVDGLSEAVPQALINLGVDPDLAPQYAEAIKDQVSQPMVRDGMPVAEAIELAQFLVESTIKFVRFTPGHQSVGGPVEIAILTRHEGFKWVKRKHHFDPALNPV